MPKIFSNFGKFTIASTMLTSSVLIALSTALDITVLAQPTKAPIPIPSSTNQPTKAPIPTPSSTNQPTNPIIQKLLGQWQSKDPSSDLVLTFIFSSDGKLYVLSPDSQNPMAIAFEYKINPTPQPMHLDVSVSKEQKSVETIFEFTADGQLRLQLDNTSPKQSRPTAFSPTATLFKKVSDTTKLPENIKLIDPHS